MSNPITEALKPKEPTLRLDRDPVNKFIKEMAELVVRKAQELSKEDIKTNG